MTAAATRTLGALALAAFAVGCAGTSVVPDTAFAGSSQGASELSRCEASGGDAVCKQEAAERLVAWNREVSACYGYAWQYPYSSDPLIRQHINRKRWMRLGEQAPMSRHGDIAGDVEACRQAARTALDAADQGRLYARMCGMGSALGCACMEDGALGKTVQVDGQVHSCAGGEPIAGGVRASAADLEAEIVQSRPSAHSKCTGAYCRCHESRSVYECLKAAQLSGDAVGAFYMLRLGCPTENLDFLSACYGDELEGRVDHLGLRLSEVIELARCVRGEAADGAACARLADEYERGRTDGEARLAKALGVLGAGARETRSRLARHAENRRRFEAEGRQSRRDAISAGLRQLGSGFGSSGASGWSPSLRHTPPPQTGPAGKPSAPAANCGPDEVEDHGGACHVIHKAEKVSPVCLGRDCPGYGEPGEASEAVQQ